MIESELVSEKGKIASQFIMGQRYIKALAKLGKPDNIFLVRSSIDQVPNQVDQSVNLLDLVNNTSEVPASVANGNGSKPTTPKKTTRKTVSWK